MGTKVLVRPRIVAALALAHNTLLHLRFGLVVGCGEKGFDLLIFP